MEMYEVRARKVDGNGYNVGYEVLGYAYEENKAKEYVEKWIKETMNKPEWWLHYGTEYNKNFNKTIDVIIERKVLNIIE